VESRDRLLENVEQLRAAATLTSCSTCGASPQASVAFLARWPARQAMQHARERVRALTGRERLRWPVEQIVGDLNRFLRGWAGYFRYGNSTVQFDQIIRHADTRLALWVAKRHQQHRRYGWQTLAASPDRRVPKRPSISRSRRSRLPNHELVLAAGASQAHSSSVS